MAEINPATISARLPAAGLRVKPLDWQEDYPYAWSGPWLVCFRRMKWRTYKSGLGESQHDTKEDVIAACEARHAAAVLAMLEPIPSEEPQP